MQDLSERLQALSSAEDFFQFFGLNYDARVVHVNRLHILKRFTQYLKRDVVAEGENEIDTFKRYRAHLQQAYEDFTRSSGVQEKLFQVFQKAEGQQHVSLDGLKASLHERRLAA